jgi:hypothetical protein
MRRLTVFLLTLLAGTTCTRGQEFRVETGFESPAKLFSDGKRWYASVVDASGGVRYTIEREVPYGSPFPALAISPDEGWGIFLDAFEGIVEFLDATGAPVRSLRPFGDSAPNHERILKCSIGRTMAAFLWSIPDGESACAALFSASGDEIWNRRLHGNCGGEVQISKEGDYVLAGSSSFRESPQFTTELFDAVGDRIASIPHSFRSAYIAEAEAGALPPIILSDGRTLYRLRADTATEIWSVGAGNDVITDVAMSSDGTILALVQNVSAGDMGIRYGESRLLTSRGQATQIRPVNTSGEDRLSFHRSGDRLWIHSESSARSVPLEEIN